ncbi:hypothetical protein [Candidatus Aalborgicola defluviihabitans]|uniref:hypothetical protein n=1 Tax=Candidatus Aalborgicola defluviihabitans TaxID=3386187 RepID=UPI0039B97169
MTRDVCQPVIGAGGQHHIHRHPTARRQVSAISNVASGTKYGVTMVIRRCAPKQLEISSE